MRQSTGKLTSQTRQFRVVFSRCKSQNPDILKSDVIMEEQIPPTLETLL